MKTSAAILVEQHKPLVLDEVEVPALQTGQVLVQVKTSRICGSQLGEIDGVKGPDRFLPHLLGHEGGGIVLETGPDVTRVKAGDSVVLHWRPGAGLQVKAPVYQWGSRKVSAGWVTTFNEFAVVAENRLTSIPKNLDFEIAALLADTLTTGFGVINNDARVKIGESVVLFGCGGIGLGAILGAKLAGAYPIIAVDLFEHKLNKAREYGATHVINSSKTDAAAAVREIVGGQGADVVIDGTGQARIIEMAYLLTQPKGRCVLFGVMPHDKSVTLHTLPLHFGKILTGSEGGGSQPHLDIPRLVRMIQDGRFDPKGFISHRVKLSEINETIQKMRSGEVIHAIIHFD
ncbi:MAG: zinc-binding dehydrogenase [Methylacidiphilales bacterium]|nr:zinc-binding dehydrogenase [Candidatus Methylacidiphilales bacterium]